MVGVKPTSMASPGKLAGQLQVLVAELCIKRDMIKKILSGLPQHFDSCRRQGRGEET